ncbi:hypothetical protein [Thermoanaerobacter italicus]|uniref:hypothetical protein n=1 Tax=Thermoanaerobacter italicus TaxID=108150 RepID=UPI00030D6DB3|nr:hypothetical protein [Thermoanaerobacter italicus]
MRGATVKWLFPRLPYERGDGKKKKLLVIFFIVNILFTSCFLSSLGDRGVVPLGEEDAIDLHYVIPRGMT